MNLHNWPVEIKRRVFSFFLKLSQSTAKHKSFYALAKALGILKAIADSDPRGLYDAQEIAYFRAKLELEENECRERLHEVSNDEEAQKVSLDCYHYYNDFYENYKILEDAIIHRFNVDMN